MKSTLIFCILISQLAYSQEKTACDVDAQPYWAYGINSRVVGENITIRKVFEGIQRSEDKITPENGFITLRINISKSGDMCDIETFQIDEDYNPTIFNLTGV